MLNTRTDTDFDFKAPRIRSKRFHDQDAWIPIRGCPSSRETAAGGSWWSWFGFGFWDRDLIEKTARPSRMSRTGACARASARASCCGSDRKYLILGHLRCPMNCPMRICHVAKRVTPANLSPIENRTRKQRPNMGDFSGLKSARFVPRPTPCEEVRGQNSGSNSTPDLLRKNRGGLRQKTSVRNNHLKYLTTDDNRVAYRRLYWRVCAYPYRRVGFSECRKDLLNARDKREGGSGGTTRD